jgi:uncharacterized protein YndB with AHSA1/START domain
VTVGPVGDAISIVADLPQPPETVWQALTEPAHVAAWWGDYVELDARPGGRLLERWADDDGTEKITEGEVLAAVAPARLEMSWADRDWNDRTRVLIELEPAGEGTRLTLTHSGWDAFEPDRRRRLIEALEAGWECHLENLRAHLSG